MDDDRSEPNHLQGTHLTAWRDSVRAWAKVNEVSLRTMAETSSIPLTTLRLWLRDSSSGPNLWGRGEIAKAMKALTVRAPAAPASEPESGDGPS